MEIKTKKIWSWGCVVLSVGMLITWACWPEYGKGYSEDQRRNWNEMVVKRESYRGVNRYRALMMPFDFSSLNERARQPDAPEWRIDLSSPFLPEHCPKEGMRVSLLKRLANQGDGDACLELVFRAIDHYSTGFLFPELEGFFQVETYLKKSVALGRPGADYLLRVFECKKRERRGGESYRVRTLKGREAFLPYLDEGDFMLGKVYLYLDPDGDEALDRLNSGLRRKAEKGDVVALRNAGHLAFLRKQRGEPNDYNILSYNILSSSGSEFYPLWNVIERGKNGLVRRFPVLSEFLNESEQTIGECLTTKSWKNACEEREPSLELLWKAAEQGDLHAKYLWVRYSMCIHHLYSREEWRNWWIWVDDLMKTGGMYGKRFLKNEFPTIFYERTSYERIMSQLAPRSAVEEAACFPDVKDASMISIHMEAAESMQDFSSPDFEGRIESVDEKACASQLMEQAAKEGDPYAMLSLSILLIEGKWMKEDAGRAWDLLGRLEKWLKDVPGEVIDNESVQKDIAWQRWNCVSRYGDMPGMTVKEAFDQWCAFMNSVKKEGFFSKYKEQESLLKKQFEACGFRVSDENE